MAYVYAEATAPPINQQGPGYCVHNGKKYVFGGSTDATNPNAKALVYDPVTDSWEYLTDMPSARWHPAVESIGDFIYIFGGKTGSGSTVTGSGWKYDPELDTYTSITSMPTARSHAFNAVVDGKMYVIGGHNGTTFNVTTNECYDPDTDSWSAKASMPTGRGDVDSAPVVDGLIYCIGGYNGADSAAVEAYDPTADSWVTGLEPMPTGRNSMGVGALGTKIIVAGGYRHATSARQKYVEVYDTVGDTWNALDDLAYPKENPAVGVIENTLYLSHGAEQNYHETITDTSMEEDLTPDFSEKNITGGTISSENGVVTITLTTGEAEVPDPVYGCTDPEANNYDPEATVDDSTCTYDPPPGNGLLTGLVSWYDLDADANDSHGSNNLTNNGSIAFSSGAQFAASKYFSITDAAQTGLDLSNEFTLHIRHTFSSVPSGSNDAQDFVSKWVGTGNQRSFIWSYRNDSGGSPGFSLFVCSNGSTNEQLRKGHSLVASTSYDMTVTWKGPTSTAEFFVNGSSIGSTTGSITSLHNGTADFLVGQQGGANFLKGTGKRLGIWNKVLTGAQIATLAGGAAYNTFD